MSQISLDVWQFVRLMVRLEETLEFHGGGRGSAVKALYDRWEDTWVDLDAKLVDYGKHDLDRFADLMMDQEVHLDEVSAEDKEIVCRELQSVVDQIKARLAQSDDPDDVEDLSFERDELTLTIRVLRGGKKRK